MHFWLWGLECRSLIMINRNWGEDTTRQFGRAVKAVVLGTIPKGHGFESHSCHVF